MDFMIDLKECQTEVLRLSEQRIKARKRNRSRIMAMCIPLILIVSLWSVSRFPEMGMNDSMEVQIGIIADDSAVVIQNSETNYEKITDSAVVSKVRRTLDDYFSENSDVVMVNPEVSEDDFSHIADSSSPIGYFITFTDSEGGRTIYHLSENLLTNTETNETITLTDDQLLQLKTDLGITD